MIVTFPDDLHLPFEVPWHDRMALRISGKHGDTVLAVEAQIFNFTVKEYVEPLSWERQWCYETMGQALVALSVYLHEPEQDEPAGWIRSIVAGQPIRHARVEPEEEQ